MIEWNSLYNKSVPCLVVDKVRQVFVSEVLYSNVYVQQVPNKSHSQELNNVLFVVVVVQMINFLLYFSPGFCTRSHPTRPWSNGSTTSAKESNSWKEFPNPYLHLEHWHFVPAPCGWEDSLILRPSSLLQGSVSLKLTHGKIFPYLHPFLPPGVYFINGLAPLQPIFAPCAQLLRSFYWRKSSTQGAKVRSRA